jgi:hypothetical protein
VGYGAHRLATSGFLLIHRVEPLQEALREPGDVLRQIRPKPHEIAPMPRPDRLEQLLLLPVAAVQQRLQLSQLVLKNVRRVGAQGCVVGSGQVLPGDNLISHLMCALSKLLHVDWSDGHGVSAPWPSPFLPHIDIAAVCISMSRREAWRSTNIRTEALQSHARAPNKSRIAPTLPTSAKQNKMPSVAAINRQ